MHPDLNEAVLVLRRGGVVAFPTDTVWGVLADPETPKAIERIYAMKGRPRSQPLQLLVADLEAATRLLPEGYHDPRFEALAARFWPGPLTLVLPAGKRFPAIGVHDRIGLRMPDHAELRALLKTLGGYAAATSLNRSGEPPVTSEEEAPFSRRPRGFGGSTPGGGLERRRPHPRPDPSRGCCARRSSPALLKKAMKPEYAPLLAVLFAAGRAVQVEELVRGTGWPEEEVRRHLDELKRFLADGDLGVDLEQVAGGWRLVVHPRYTPTVHEGPSPPPAPA